MNERAIANPELNADVTVRANVNAKAKVIADATVRANVNAKAKAIADATVRVNVNAKAIVDAMARANVNAKAKASADVMARVIVDVKAKVTAGPPTIAVKWGNFVEYWLRSPCGWEKWKENSPNCAASMRISGDNWVVRPAQKVKVIVSVRAKASANVKAGEIVAARVKATVNAKVKAIVNAKAIANAMARATVDVKVKVIVAARAIAPPPAGCLMELAGSRAYLAEWLSGKANVDSC
ncbi:MAG: hypothetical protein QGG42_07855 [Phycisphaerae bacterium]|nr:hypothetical protein [Phycisphaerae bacterium]